MKNKFALSLLTLCSFGLVNAFGQVAAKRTFDHGYYFGDSLTDNGNTYAATSALGSPTPPAPYYMGRFSNGLVYSEYLTPGLVANSLITAGNVPANINFAFGGANANIVGSLAVPTLTQQVGLFQARGLTNNANSLFVVLAGANDLIGTITVPATQNVTAVQTTATNAANAVGTNVRSLLTLGAKTVVVMNLPDLSLVPRFTNGTLSSVSALGATGSSTFNSTLKTNLAAASLASDVNLRLVDLGGLYNTILKNSAALGFSNSTGNVVAVLSAGGTVTNPNSYVFFDDIHPTNAVHQLLASALTEVVNPEFVLGTADTQRLALQTIADLSADTIDQRLAALRQVAATSSRPAGEMTDAYVSYNTRSGNFAPLGYAPGSKLDLNAVTAGIDRRFGKDFLAGVSFSNNQIDGHLSGSSSSDSIKGNAGALYAQWTASSCFIEGSLNFGTYDLNTTRSTALGGLNTTAKTQGKQVGVALKLGRSFEYKSAQLTPFVGLRAQNTTIDAYRETGVAGLNFDYDSQSIRSLTALAGITADWKFTLGGKELAFGLGAIYQADQGSNSRDLTGRLADTVATTSSIRTAEGLGDTLKLRASVGGKIAETWGWQASYTRDQRSKADAANQYSLTVSKSF